MTSIPYGADGADDSILAGSKAVEALVWCIIIGFSVIGNTSLWIVLLRSQSLRTVTNMFILGLSAADLLVATVNMPLTVFTIIEGYWMLSNTACVAVGFINMLTLVTSVLSLCNISINRFFMVCRPGKFKDIYTTRNAILMIIATVTCAVLLSSPPLLGWSKYVYTPTHSFCFADWVNYESYAYFMIGCCFGIPFGVMTFCNICIIRSVRESRRKVRSTYRATMSSPNNSVYEYQSKKEDKEYDMTDARKSDLSTSTAVTELGNNNNTESKENIKRDHAHADIQLQIPKYDDKYDEHKHKDLKQRPMQDSLSDDSSNESNSALISQLGRQSPRRNQLFEEGNQNKEKLKSLVRPESPTTEKQNNIDTNLLHPRWKRRSVSEISKEPSVNLDSCTDTVRRNDKMSVTEKPTSVKLRSPTRIRRREEIRLAFSLIIVVVLFVICWLPYCISMLLSIYIHGSVPREFHMFTLLIGYANSGCNPIVYGLMNQRFKVGFKRLFCFWKTHVFNLSSNS
ncbi:tyramine receptor Ser-2-like isoform X2 [Mercenaria mercenaria]|uniref:tyramine receptor Ser-2-like isoform X2 n=1 Tax=Mercenaria mercenaria TaxID=6596 RepID=UPI00234EFC8C|nr:tyramine receptor Ser-2-like isoform X2 [Mercenaria mercenaria]